MSMRNLLLLTLRPRLRIVRNLPGQIPLMRLNVMPVIVFLDRSVGWALLWPPRLLCQCETTGAGVAVDWRVRPSGRGVCTEVWSNVRLTPACV